MGLLGAVWGQLKDLPVTVESWSFERLATPVGSGRERVTTTIRLRGCGDQGLGEDVSVLDTEDETLHRHQPSATLAGHWTLAELLHRVTTIDQWPLPPRWPALRPWRNWGFESAALDLALCQAGMSIIKAFGRPLCPVRFVNSLSLGAPPTLELVHRRLERYPALRLKVDAVPSWSPSLVRSLAATGAVDIVDFKGWYAGPTPPHEALLAMYERVVEAFPDAIFEDPHDLPEVTAMLAGRSAPVSYDAPLRDWQSLERVPLEASAVNVKPSRLGGVYALLDFYQSAETAGVMVYGGGMDELGAGRDQVQLLAALLHPDAPNDVAPAVYNHRVPPWNSPVSPLLLTAAAAGFRLA